MLVLQGHGHISSGSYIDKLMDALLDNTSSQDSDENFWPKVCREGCKDAFEGTLKGKKGWCKYCKRDYKNRRRNIRNSRGERYNSRA